MISDLIKPYPREDDLSFSKRKAYYFRFLEPRLVYGPKCFEEKQMNTKPISVADLEVIDAFWAPYLTPEQREKLIDYRFYDVYNKVLRERERLCEYMPETFFYVYIDEYFSNPQHSKPCDDKNLYDLYFHDVNRPKTVFRKSQGMFLNQNYDDISLDDAIAMAREHGEVILKECRFSGGGHGVKFWNSATDDESIIREFMKNPKDLICQSLIKQHSELSRLNPTSVNTVRIMTLVIHGKVHVLSSVLRMGVNGARVDNASSGGIVCGIKPNGQLKNEAYDTAANRYDKHPQGTAFESVTIPNFDECIHIATIFAKRFASVSRLISWDFAIGEDGYPILVEFNVSWGQLDFHQLCNGPIFGELTEDVLGEVFNNSYTLNCILKSMRS